MANELNTVMECVVLAVAPDVFRGKAPGETDTTMYRLYIQAANGRVGYLYSRNEYAAGDVVRLGLAERDGKLKLAVLQR